MGITRRSPKRPAAETQAPVRDAIQRIIASHYGGNVSSPAAQGFLSRLDAYPQGISSGQPEALRLFLATRGLGR